MTTELIDTLEISKMFGVTRHHVTSRITKRPDFPKPCVDLSQRLRRWKKDEVLRWVKSNGGRNGFW